MLQGPNNGRERKLKDGYYGKGAPVLVTCGSTNWLMMVIMARGLLTQFRLL
jgi:hypothetical protein